MIAERDPDAEAATHAADLAECDETWDAAPRQVTVEADGTSALEEVTPEVSLPCPTRAAAKTRAARTPTG